MISNIIISCDVCSKKIKEIEVNELNSLKETYDWFFKIIDREKYPVIRVRDNIGGNKCVSYLDYEYLHICKDCEDYMNEGNFLFSETVMNKTKVYFKNRKE